jgi:DNA-binding protein YbaB
MGIWDQGKMLLQAKKVQKELKNTEIEASSNNGWVNVVFNAEMKIKTINFSEEALKPENKNELDRVAQQTIAEALSRAQAVAAEKTREMMKGMNLNIPGM